MPCRDYDTRWDDTWRNAYESDTKQKAMKQHADKLARIACKAMTELVKSGHADFLVLIPGATAGTHRAKNLTRCVFDQHRTRLRQKAALRGRRQRKKEIGIFLGALAEPLENFTHVSFLSGIASKAVPNAGRP